MNILNELKRVPRFLSLGIIVLAACIYVFIKYVPHDVKPYYAQCLTPFSTLIAVLFAMYAGYFKKVLDGIQLTIEVPKENNSAVDLMQDGTKVFPVYWHHLVVVNETPHQAVVNCRVWLKKIYVLKNVVNNPPVWEDNKFAVPRLMEWAPSEWERDKRTFCTKQVFDFGQKRQDDGSFFLVTNRNLRATSVKVNYSAGETIKVCLFITADNYQLEKEFYFDVEIQNRSLGSVGEVVPAKVTPSSKP